MKTSWSALLLLTGMLSLLAGSCKKEAVKIIPTITTAASTYISPLSVTCGGTISSDGGAMITARGICWGATQNPSLTDNKTIDGTGVGSFESAITGLNPGTNYYIRAYATNTVGTAYGNQVTVTEIKDYFPLIVGAKYKYNYSASYAYVNESSLKKGECTWKFISKSVDPSVVYQVEQSFTGYYVYNYYGYGGLPSRKDSTQIDNQISALSFKVQNNGKVVLTFPMPYWGGTTVTFERFIQSDKIDTCFMFSLINGGCLRKNVGITSFGYFLGGNHGSSVGYSLIEGPTF
jgi:hypothetical protein